MAGEDAAFVAWVHEQTCAARGLIGHSCAGRIEAHHAGRRALGRKAHDRTCVPLCTAAHMAWHSASGPFRDLDKEGRRDWAAKTISATQARYDAQADRAETAAW